MGEMTAFSIERLEYLAYTRQHEAATIEMFRLLEHLDKGSGGLSNIGIAPTGDLASEQRDAHFATRIVSAVATLFSDPNFHLSSIGFQRLIPLQRWLSIIFGASPLATADHLIRIFNQLGHDRAGDIALKDQDLLKFCLLYSLDSSIPLQPDTLWMKDKRMAAALFCALLSSRIVATQEAQGKKEELLGWLPSRLGEVTLDDIPFGILHDLWMHCSYAYRKDKHAIKRAVNELIRNKLMATGIRDVSSDGSLAGGKPVLMCVLEWFRSDHAMYRGHSLSMEALKRRYHLVGISLREESDEASRKVFDEVHVLPRARPVLDLVQDIASLAAAIKPRIVYYPSVGMFPETVLLANLRLASIQIAGLGHPATTHSPFIDYIVIDKDCIGDPECFSEKLVAISPLPQRMHSQGRAVAPKIRRSPELVKVAVTAAVMKFNRPFLDTLRHIATAAKVPIEFHLFCMAAFGLSKVYLQNIVRNVLGDRVVMFPHLPYPNYLRNLNDCDMFLCPFPFGNTNGIVDTARQGLPGVCLTGPEVHSHIDEALFKRLGMPAWTITGSSEEYAKAAVRLAENSAEREKIAEELLKTNPDLVLFGGDASRFCDAIEWVQQNDGRLRDQPSKLIQPPSGRGSTAL